MSKMQPSLNLHSVARILISEEKRGSQTAAWRDIVLITEDGEEFEITAFGNGSAPQVILVEDTND